ncbi:MAG: hypothetical protein VKP72_04625 [bacterium]|nr:hypothetical protein [bacterium]
MRRLLTGAVAGAFLVLTGCGGAPETSPRGLTVPTGRSPSPLPVPQGQAPLPGGRDPRVSALLEAVARTHAATRNVTFTIQASGIEEKTGKPARNEGRITVEMPARIACQITDSSDSKAIGTRMVWSGGKQMSVHTKFMGFWLKVQVDVRDPRAADCRGYFLDEVSYPMAVQTLLDPRNQVTWLGMQPVDGRPCAMLGVLSPRSLRGIRREVFAVDTASAVHVQREMFDASDRSVLRIQLRNLRLNASLPPDTFTIR